MLREGQLLVDNTGVKTGILEELVSMAPKDVEVSDDEKRRLAANTNRLV